MSASAMLAKAIFDNLADAPDELSFRRGDIVSVLEQDVDGLTGWWLCSLHGRQGIAPGNRLQEIKRRVDDEHQMQPSGVFNFEVADYDVPRSQEGDDYDVPRCVTSPNYSIATNSELEDYAVPKGFSGQATLESLAEAKLAESHPSYYLPLRNSLIKIFTEEPSVSDQGNGAIQSQDNYDIPPKGSDDDLADTVKYSVQGNSASLDQDADDVGELYDIPSTNVSHREIVVNKSLVVKEDKRIYTEIYDILPAHAEDDNRVHVQQSSQETPADMNKNSTTQEKQDRHKATKSVKPGQVSTSWSQGERDSVCSTDSVKLSSEDDDYVDYQEIYGDGKEKEVNVYDVPVQAIPFPHERDIQNRPTTKRTQVSILQRINMTAVKGIKLDPAGALQRLTKLEQAVNGTVQKLLSFVTSTWRDPDILNSQLADIRDVSGKAKVALRLLTEFALSSLVNSQLLPAQELSGKLSRAVEPLLETYYSVKLALQRLDEQDWKTPLRKVSNKHDDLDLIMVYIRSVPENSHKLASVIRTGATSLYKMTNLDKRSLDLQVLSTTGSQTMVPNTSGVEQEKSGETTISVIPSPVMDARDASFKPKVHGTKWSPTTVRRICGMNPVKPNGDGINIVAGKALSEDNAVLTLPYRLLSSVEKTTNFLPGEGPRSPPAPPQRKDSGDKCHHLRQKSVDKCPAAAAELTSSETPGPPPKPKLDRKRASRKSYKIPLFSEPKHAQKEVVLREHKGSDNEPTTPRRKCNSDPVPIQESLDAELSSVEQMLKRQSILQIRKQKSLHISDSDLPQSLKQLENDESLPVDEIVGSRSFHRQNSARDVLQHRPLSTILKGGNRFMVSLNDRELLEFYKYEIDAQLFVLGEAIKGFFAAIEKNESPKVFVSSSKFIVLSAHKFVFIGDTLSSKISNNDLRSKLEIVTSQLSNSIKTLVNSTKSAALQYPATNAMREMSDCVLVVNDTAIELHQVVKETTSST